MAASELRIADGFMLDKRNSQSYWAQLETQYEAAGPGDPKPFIRTRGTGGRQIERLSPGFYFLVAVNKSSWASSCLKSSQVRCESTYPQTRGHGMTHMEQQTCQQRVEANISTLARKKHGFWQNARLFSLPTLVRELFLPIWLYDGDFILQKWTLLFFLNNHDCCHLTPNLTSSKQSCSFIPRPSLLWNLLLAIWTVGDAPKQQTWKNENKKLFVAVVCLDVAAVLCLVAHGSCRVVGGWVGGCGCGTSWWGWGWRFW